MKPLKGIRVLDFTDIWAGPWTSRILLDLGAHVIKIEGPSQKPRLPQGAFRAAIIVSPETDEQGRPRYFRNGYQTITNPGKDHIALDLKKEEAVALFKGLVQISDVVVENYAPRVMDNLGLGYQDLRKVRPDIIMLRVSAMGHTGPEREYTGLGFTAELLSGMDSITGYENGEPHKTGINYGDPIAGVHGALAVIGALIRRTETGKGTMIDLSLRESLSMLLGEHILGYSMNQQQQPRLGNRDQRMAPHNIYRCQGDDRWVLVAVGSDSEFASLCDVIGHPELADDSRFTDKESRKGNERELDSYIEAWTSQQTHYEAMHALQKAGVAAGAVLNTEELVNDPHMTHNGAFQWIELPNGKSYPIPQLPWRIPSAPHPNLTPTPPYGNHNRYIFEELISLSHQEVDTLIETGAILT